MPTSDQIHLAIALDGAGWHPAAWREQNAEPDRLLSPRYWGELVAEAERGLADFVTIEDSFGLRSATLEGLQPRTDLVSGRLDSVLIAARVAPASTHIGIIPTAVVTHTEPFHLSKAIATLDYVSKGRGGVRLQVSAQPHEAALLGRREFPQLDRADLSSPAAQAVIADLFEEAGDYAEVLRRLWDSWEDDAEIRDKATGRFVDRDKLHYIGFEGRFFSVRGPSITPRPPQGQPIIAALGHQQIPFELIGASTDVGFITPTDPDDARSIIGTIRAAQQRAGREDEKVHVFADLVVFLADTDSEAARRTSRLDDRAGAEYSSDAQIFVGTAAGLADRIEELKAAGVTGVRLRPGTIPDDLRAITAALVPELQRRGIFRTEYTSTTLRGHLGLTRPANRYAATQELINR
ncbi:alkanesulfonate monooxygenase SsuD/methylene tetrahydromethanopterin reductase-like flavin-dependent oxidoreductase (luciferase family) [Williamsia limnetica]|uniref:Alkanesulfonate monooxygenase SsuD/methylene tetrahydromethanopterin reductase-like flavin-dependent oxidoreductase (Luciferase family) n=1 Tax=Williamsia limnetica TaxID=882452 RepID=A0A318RJB8_WILLI|nr:LLM class flavin-dependent oxidoreductase [Williamsia limnetica]PYE15146.1 alkanesulfonate monooxygenase SsuD/methylene tetrahydromethanopterin reductase-like flavin-dependent oxidoreductase (luciferase family) [Williamsia limnetica]